MKANEAREKSKAAASTEIAEIIRKISDAIKKSETRVTVDCASGGTLAYFEDEGYEIEQIIYGFGRRMTVITW